MPGDPWSLEEELQYIYGKQDSSIPPIPILDLVYSNVKGRVGGLLYGA